MITIRKSKFKDLPRISKLVLGQFVKEINSHIKELETSKEASPTKFIEDYIWRAEERIPSVIYVAEKDGKLIGVAGGSITEHHWGNSLWGNEEFWFIKKEYRKGKTGLKLFNMLMKWFKDNGATRICMTHYSWNPKVGDFYEKKGFKPYEVNYVKEVANGS